MIKKKPVYSISDRLWGEDGPYSEVKLIIETRILDERISRTFVIVEVSINPYTFELIRKHKTLFYSDKMIQQLLEHSEYRGQSDGYVSMAFSEEYGPDVLEKAQQSVEYCKNTIVKMHQFVMKQLNNKKNIN